MTIERWGSLSVADHNDVAALTANVLLYDRLVLPMFTEANQRQGQTELEYWQNAGWNPDLQQKRKEQLGELAIACAWDDAQRYTFSNRFAAASQMNEEVSGEMITRTLLTENQDQYEFPKGVSHADIFVAYHSQQDAQDEIPFTEADPQYLGPEAQVGILLAHEFDIPAIDEPEIALREAIGLGKESEFRKKRAELYNFQMTCLQRGMKPKAIVAELRELNQELADFMQKQKIATYKRTGFMLAQVSLGIIGGTFFHPLAAVGGLLSIWQFAAFDAIPSTDVPSRLAPVAGFYDINKSVGVGL